MEDRNNSYKFKGVVKSLLPPKTGQSDKGEWFIQHVLIEGRNGEYPLNICFEINGRDKAEKFDLHEGEEVVVNFNLQSSNFNGKWFTAAKIWSCYKPGQRRVQQDDETMTMNQAMGVDSNYDKGINDLPF